jgi:hypothetical protein
MLRERAKQLIAPDEIRIASLRRKNAAIIMEGVRLKRDRLSPNSEPEQGPVERLITVAVDSGLKLESGGVRPDQSCALAKTKEGCCSSLRCRELYATALLTHSIRALP